MIRGTTPVLAFKLPFEASMIDTGYLTISQNRQVVLDIPLDTATKDGYYLKIHLTQEDTLKLVDNYEVDLQLRVKIGSESLASRVLTTKVGRILKGGEI